MSNIIYRLDITVNSENEPSLVRVEMDGIVNPTEFALTSSPGITNNGDGSWDIFLEGQSLNDYSSPDAIIETTEEGEIVSSAWAFSKAVIASEPDVSTPLEDQATRTPGDYLGKTPADSLPYYEAKSLLISSDKPGFSYVDLDGNNITEQLGMPVVNVVDLGNSEWQVSFKIDTKQEYLGKVSAIFKLNGGNELNGFGLVYVPAPTKVEYTFKDANEAKVFIKDVNNDARAILAKVNVLESSKLRQERILDSADRLYNSYESRIIKLQERMDAILSVRDERVASLLLAFEAELEKSELIANDIIKLKAESDFSSKALAIESIDSEFSKAIPPVIKSNFEKVRLSEKEASLIVKKNVEVIKADVISKLRGEQSLDAGDRGAIAYDPTKMKSAN